MKEKLTQKEILKKVKKIIEIVGEDSKEARKIIKILKASYDFRKNQFKSILQATVLAYFSSNNLNIIFNQFI